ncbi:ORF6N domain-containing protein [Pedobacter glucosidilyticus]|uniref:ORF6N domain-containing protein n=1 Tax=Pedobacter glucosidilyticus TaxID=1122941 RepID=UPI0026E9D3BA|nr:ORF6N domain-containing protein [Pedobacter glucosidilyticus]
MNKTATHKEEVNLPDEMVMNQIYVIRGQKVMLDKDLAVLYGVETKTLNQAVKRNMDRFPEDFMFELSKEEFELLRSQIVTSKDGRGGRRYLPNAFTEQGVAMLSSVINSKQAIQVNIQIMRIFTRVRQMLSQNTEFKLEIAEIKQAINKIAKKQDGHDKNIDLLFEYIDRLQEKTEEPKQERKRIGYKEW